MNKKLTLKRLVIIMFFIVLSIALTNSMVFAKEKEEEEFYEAEEVEYERKENKLSNVTKEMLEPEYWEDKTIVDWEKELMTQEEIVDLNQAIVDGSGTKVFDLTDITKVYDADAKQQTLANVAIPERDLYIEGELIDNEEYFTEIKEAIRDTGYTGIQNMKYGICTNRTDMKDWPTDDIIGYTATDRDDENEISAMNVNEAFAIYAKCEINDKKYYWGYSNNCSGWVNSNTIALCQTEEEWTNYWKVDHSKDDYIVDDGGKIDLKQDGKETVHMMLGTILKLVPENETPTYLQDKVEDNYIVFFAGMDDNGNAVKQYGVINKDLGVNKGFLELNQKNLLTVAFACLGDDYGWGGMNGEMDCSLYTRSIYKCFGFELPRNTTWQLRTPGRLTDILKMTDEEKGQYISTLPAGSLLYFNGHVMVYIGMDKNKNFVVSDVGKACDEDSTELQEIYAVNVNSVNVKRANGTTWLSNLDSVITLYNEFELSDCKIKVNTGKLIKVGAEYLPTVTVEYNNCELFNGVNYKIEYIDNLETGKKNIKITGLNNFSGETILPSYSLISTSIQEYIENKITKFEMKIDGEYDLFDRVEVDFLELIKNVDYIVTQGSTIIDFTQLGIDKLNTLSPGEYSVNAIYTNGAVVSEKLIIHEDTTKKEESTEQQKQQEQQEDDENIQTKYIQTTNKTNPKTGDNIFIIITLLLISLSAFLITLRKRK